MLLAAAISACGGGGSSDANEPAGTFHVRVVSAKFPTEQSLAETSLMEIGVRNTGHRTVPALTISTTVGGKQGETSALPFAYHDPQPDLAQPDRPIWVLDGSYPRLEGGTTNAGATTANPKTFDFGPLEPGATETAVWKLTASKPGHYTVLYRVDGSLNGEAKAKGPGGVAPGGSFAVNIDSQPPNQTVNGKGEVVPVPEPKDSGR